MLRWPIRAVPLTAEPLTDPRDASTVDERLALVAKLTAEQWRMAGLELPTYARHEMPGRVFRTKDLADVETLEELRARR